MGGEQRQQVAGGGDGLDVGGEVVAGPSHVPGQAVEGLAVEEVERRGEVDEAVAGGCEVFEVAGGDATA